MGYASPLGSLIHDKAWARPAGNNEPKVTATFQDHLDGNRNPGLDIGTGRCNDPLYAMEAGTVSLSGLIGTAQVVRIKHPNGDESGYAHLSSRAVAVGQAVRRGQLIGALGSTGATACHLHLGVKRNGVEVDPWPLLDQNQEDDVLQGANPVRVVNRKTTVKGDNTNFRSSPFVRADNVLVKYAAGTEFYPDWAVEGTTVGTSKLWVGGWGNVLGVRAFGYLHETTVNPLIPIEQSGHSDQELAAARSKGISDAAAAAGAVK